MRGPVFIKRVVAPLCLALLMVPLFASVGRAQISGISIELTSVPTQATAGETISITVTVRKPQGVAITGYLRSYLLARVDAVAGFAGSERTSTDVALNEEGWSYSGNRIYISMDENETEHAYVLTNKIIAECPTVEALLRVRLSNVNGVRGIRYENYGLVFIEDASLKSLSIAKIAMTAAMALAMICVVTKARMGKNSSRGKPKKR